MEVAIADIPQIDKDYYRRVRVHGLSPLQVKEEWLKLHEDMDGTTGDKFLTRLLPLVVAMGTLIYAIGRQIRMQNLWITSPSGKTIRELKFYTALRIIRKRRWHLTNVIPKSAKGSITKKEALKIVLGGKGR